LTDIYNALVFYEKIHTTKFRRGYTGGYNFIF